MAKSRLNKDKNRPLRRIIGSDKFRSAGVSNVKKGVVENGNTTANSIIDALPQLDIERHLSSDSKEVLEDAASVARSFNTDLINVTHLLYALIENNDISEYLGSTNINPTTIMDMLNKRMVKGSLQESELQGSQARVTDEVNYTLKDSLAQTLKTSQQIEPIHILLTLLKKDYPEVSKPLRDANVNISSLVEEIEMLLKN